MVDSKKMKVFYCYDYYFVLKNWCGFFVLNYIGWILIFCIVLLVCFVVEKGVVVELRL